MKNTRSSTSPSEPDHGARAHSSIVGGSTAEQRLQCPGSWALEQKVPDTGGTSAYAEEGTALHEAVQFCLDNDVLDPDELLDREFNGYVMTRALIDDGVAPVLDFVDALDAEAGGEDGLQFITEGRYEFPGIPDAFGTADFVAKTATGTVVADWKFGVGVPVAASYTDEDGTVRVNAQLLFYARAAMFKRPEMFEQDPDWPVDLYIVQPRVRDGFEPVTKATVTVKDLEQFRFQLVKAIAEAKGDNPRTKRGPWCEFKRCRAVCPHFLGPKLDLAKLDLSVLAKNKPGEVEPVAKTDWAQLYGIYLPLCDVVEDVIKEIRAQAHSWLKQGHQIVDLDGQPSYKLVPKRATESYVDEAGALRHAVGLGVAKDDAVETKLKSPAQLATAMEPLVEGKTKKDRTAEARKQLTAFTTSVSSGDTLARADDGRPDVTPVPTLVAELAKRLGQL